MVSIRKNLIKFENWIKEKKGKKTKANKRKLEGIKREKKEWFIEKRMNIFLENIFFLSNN